MAKLDGDLVATPIEPADRWPLVNLTELWRTRRILWVLAQRILKVRYQQTAIGVAWVVLQPLILVIIVSVFMGLVFDRGQRLDLPFPVFLFPAWVAWRTFTKITGEGGHSIASNSTVVQRTYLPRVYFPLSVALASLVDLVFLVLAVFVVLAIYAVTPGIGLLAVPVLVVILYASSIGLALLFSATSLRYRDMDILIPLMVQALFWMSPVIYPSVLIPEPYRVLFYLNPLAVVIDGLRWAFTQTPAPPPEAWLLGSSVALILLVFGYVYFRRREPLFADWLGE